MAFGARYIELVLFRLGRQYHSHGSPFHSRRLFDNGDAVRGFHHSVQQLAAKLRVGDFPAAETNGYLNFVAVLQKLHRIFQLEVEIVVVGLGPEPDTLKVSALLLLVRLPIFLGRFVLMFPVIHDSANGRHSHGSNLDEVQPALFRDGESVSHIHNAPLFAVFINEANIPNARVLAMRAQNLFVNPEVFVYLLSP